MSETGKDRSISRRNFLKKSLFVIGSTIFGGSASPQFSQEQSTSPKPILNSSCHAPSSLLPEIPKSPETPVPFETRLCAGMEFIFNSEGLPIKAIANDYCNNGGERVVEEFSQDFFWKARQKAISEKEPQIVKNIALPNWAVVNMDKPNLLEHPLIPTLPEDVISEDRLKEEYGIFIIQPSTTKLYIRETAFLPDGIMGYHNYKKTGHTITIALCDGPYVTPRFFSDSKYDPVREIIDQLKNPSREEIQQKRQEIVSSEKEKLSRLRQEMLEAIAAGNIEKSRFLQEEILVAKSKIILYLELVSDEKIEELIIKPSVGLIQSGPETKILLAIGKREPNYMGAGIGFDIYGQCHLIEISDFEIPDYSLQGHSEPRTTDTYPNPDELILTNPSATEKNGQNPYGAISPGFTLRHEIVHDILIWNNSQNGNNENRNEYDTDKNVVITLQAAWKKWVNSGYIDNSGYPFVFQLPEGNFILTKAQRNEKKDII